MRITLCTTFLYTVFLSSTSVVSFSVVLPAFESKFFSGQGEHVGLLKTQSVSSEGLSLLEQGSCPRRTQASVQAQTQKNSAHDVCRHSSMTGKNMTSVLRSIGEEVVYFRHVVGGRENVRLLFSHLLVHAHQGIPIMFSRPIVHRCARRHWSWIHCFPTFFTPHPSCSLFFFSQT